MPKSKTRANTDSGSSKERPLFPYHAFYDNYTRLGISNQQAAMILQQVRYWTKEDSLPFPSNTTVARKMGVSSRMVRYWKKDLQKKGYLRLETRFERKRQTSSLMDYGPLVQTLIEIEDRDSREEVCFRDARKPVSTSPRKQASYLEGSSSTSVEESPKEKGGRYETSSSTLPGGGGPPSEGRVSQEDSDIPSVPNLVHMKAALIQKRPESPKFSFSPREVTQGAEAQMGIKEDLEAGSANVMTKSSKTAKSNAERYKTRHQRKLEKILSDPTTSSQERKNAERQMLAIRWRELMGVHFDRKELPKYTKADYGKFERLLDNWTYEKAMRLIEFAVPNWRRLTKTWKNAPVYPVFGYFLAVAESFMDVVNAQEQFAEAKAALDAWDAKQDIRSLQDPPNGLLEDYKDALAILTQAGMKPEEI
jgi:hypothetical protein